MKHLYIHIPFCLKKCGYCDFFSVTDLSLIEKYIEALCKEITARSCPKIVYSACHCIETIYFGGGTPSILTLSQFDKVFEALNKAFSIADNAEITLEANPETIDLKKLLSFKEIGFNRISIGVQSFIDEDLTYLGRVHTAEKAKGVLQDASNLFDNLSLDIIFGLPGDTVEKLKYNIKQALIFKPQHISCYELTYEKETPLYNDRVEKDEDQQIEQYNTVKQLLRANSYNRYEISNYALPGFECRHNLAYWSDKSYLGLGTSAHSYDRQLNVRWNNTSDLSRYLEGNFIAEREPAKDIDKIITGLRKCEGILISNIPKQYLDALNSLEEEEMVERRGNNIALTEKGTLLANQVLLTLL